MLDVSGTPSSKSNLSSRLLTIDFHTFVSDSLLFPSAATINQECQNHLMSDVPDAERYNDVVKKHIFIIIVASANSLQLQMCAPVQVRLIFFVRIATKMTPRRTTHSLS